jgi:hypothetical protein
VAEMVVVVAAAPAGVVLGEQTEKFISRFDVSCDPDGRSSWEPWQSQIQLSTPELLSAVI